MTHDRAAFITAYRALHGGTDTEADRILRGVEQAYAAKENAELRKENAELRQQLNPHS